MGYKGDKCYIIAEIGGNFCDLDTAKRLIDDAKSCGVDAVKLQTYRSKTLASKEAMFDMENTGVASQTEYFEKYELDEEMHREIFQYAKQVGLDILSTPSHITDVELLDRVGTDVYKLGADDLTNLPFIHEVAKRGKTIMLSTGMGTMTEVRQAVDAIIEEGNRDIIIMHVVSLYPTAPQYANLNAITKLKEEFPEFIIGYSDHTMTIDACLFGAVMGAQVVEKHFTYDKNADGPDHMHSATPDEMKTLVEKIRLFEQMKGTGIKGPVAGEIVNRKNNRKSVVATRDIKAGEVFSHDNIDIKRPGFGIQPKDIGLVLGRRAKSDIGEDAIISWGEID